MIIMMAYLYKLLPDLETQVFIIIFENLFILHIDIIANRKLRELYETLTFPTKFIYVFKN